MQQQSSTTSRIARNTIALYIRSFITMLITLYTSRVILQVLGVEDYGVYNAVGGVVVFFTVLDSAMSASCQRFLNYEMGQGNQEGVNEVFCSSINIQGIISTIIFLITEIVGLYLLYHYMVIPEERMTAAFWVFQFSVVTMVINTMSIPYNAMVIAMERMGAFAYIDVLNTFLKLCAVIVLQYLSWDKLILYGLFIMLIQILTRYIYSSYCSRNFREAKYHFVWNQTIVKRMLGFSFWTVFGSVATMLMTNGMSILYNRFYGVIANAAIGIGNQVMMAVRKLTGNMSISFAPQIVKRYSEGDFSRVSIVWTIGSKCTFFLFSLFTIPIAMNAHYILELWLAEVPKYAPEFMTLLLIENLIRCFSSNASAIVRATGRIRNYELISNGVRVFFFTLVVIGFFLSDNIFLGYYIYIANTLFQMTYNVYIGCKSINYSIRKYYLNNIVLMALSLGVAAGASYLLIPEENNMMAFVIHVISTIGIIIVSFSVIGLLPDERKYLFKNIQMIVSKKYSKKK